MLSESDLLSLVRHSPEALIAVDEDGCITHWNPEAQRLCDYSADEVEGRSLDFLDLADAKPRGDARDGDPPTRKPLRRRDGTQLHVELRTIPRAAGGNLLFVRDVSTEDALTDGRKALEQGRLELRRLARRLFQAQEDERRRLAREIHDDASQRLAAAVLNAKLLQRQEIADPVEIEYLTDLMQKLLHDLRHLSHELHPGVLEESGLVAALDTHVEELAKQGFEVRFSRHDEDLPTTPEVALSLYRIAQEALRNVRRHSGVLRAHLSLIGDGAEVRLAVADAGVGFQPSDDAQGLDAQGLGMTSMAERARLLGGRLRISSAPGAGTEIEAAFPLLEPEDDESDAPEEGGERRIGPYRLLETLGEGSTAIVYLAQEPPPLERRVALKVHRAAHVDRRETYSFKAERQAFARLRHPNIAQIYEARTTEEEDLYLVMEYIKGLPITEYCDRYRLDLRARLELFRAVCEGVQHAHQKGVLHRDLKPANILVSEEDGVAVPKLIDFGVAKGLDQPLTEHTVWGDSEIVGTPVYLSPEAWEGKELDTRSDVWSLGVLLDELLAGARRTTGADLISSLRERGPEEEVRLPSRRFHALAAEDAAAVAQARDASPRALSRALRGDLDWIAAKALAIEPSRRYVGPATLADDVERFLRDEPTLAGPPSRLDRARRFARRHRTAVAAGFLIVLSLVGGLTAAVWQAQRAAREAATSERVAEFMMELFKAGNPLSDDRELTARELLDRGTERIDTELADEPEIRARLLHVMGGTYYQLGHFDVAASLLDEALALRRELYGEVHLAVAKSLRERGNVALGSGTDDPLPFYRESAAVYEAILGPNHPEFAKILDNVAIAHQIRGEYEEARRLSEQSLAILERVYGPDHFMISQALHNLSGSLYALGLYDETEATMKRSLAIAERELPPDHSYFADIYQGFSLVYQEQERLQEATVMAERAFVIAEATWGDEHPKISQLLETLATLYREAGDAERAEAALRRAGRGDEALESSEISE